jgi:hypothetical protein
MTSRCRWEGGGGTCEKEEGWDGPARIGVLDHVPGVDGVLMNALAVLSRQKLHTSAVESG